MVIASLLLATKIAGLGMGFLPDTARLSASVLSKAEAAPAAESPHAAPAAAHGAAPAEPATKAAATPARPMADQAPPAMPSGPPPVVVTDAERQLLLDLRTRRQELEAKERILAEREGVMQAAEQRLNARVTQLTALQARLEQLDADRRKREETNWTGLVKVYETMKPRDAAAIFNDMDMPVLLQVVDRMKDSKTALIFAAMQPDRARMLTTQLAAMRTHATVVPTDKPDAG
jgi:flagellar motility protein MotE (MotC chaperone)